MRRRNELPPEIPPEKQRELQEISQHQRRRAEELFQGVESAAKELAEKAIRDKLTGLLNRRGSAEELEKGASRLTPPDREPRAGSISHFTLALLDIDNFKPINDTYGHDAGDQVLRAVAQYLTHETRKTDTLGRWGGEEFILGVEGLDVMKVLETKFNLGRGGSKNAHIMVPVAVKTPDGSDVNLAVTLSGGVTEYQPGESLRNVVERADQALYAAKHSGRNLILPWNKKMAELAQEKRSGGGK